MTCSCNVFGISRQAYYKQKQTVKRKQKLVGSILEQVMSVRRLMPRIGTRKLYYLLGSDLSIGRDKLFDILRSNHLLIYPKKSYHVTTNSKHWLKKHKNIVNDLAISNPEHVWVSDITYLGTRKHPLYLSLVSDAYSKKIMGYNLSDSLKQDGAISALKMAFGNRSYPGQTIIHHSDRGLQYCGYEYQRILHKQKAKCSMTEKSDPYENAIAERINGILKNEFYLDQYAVKQSVMNKIVKQTIDIYNNHRPHWSCNLLTPSQMHKQREIAKPTYKKKFSSKKIPTAKNNYLNL